MENDVVLSGEEVKKELEDGGEEVGSQGQSQGTSVEDTTIAFKVSLNEELRRFRHARNEVTFQRVKDSICVAFKLGSSSSSSGSGSSVSFVVQYQDEEADWITVSSDRELNEALDLAGSGIIKLRVVKGTPSEQQQQQQLRQQQPPSQLLQTQSKQTRPPTSSYSSTAAASQPIPHQQLPQSTMPQFQMPTLPAFQKRERAPRRKCGVKHMARFIKDVTVEDGTEYPPNYQFRKVWKFRNEGDTAWPAKSELVFVGKQSDRMGSPEVIPTNVTSCLPGEEVEVSILLQAPTKGGRYIGYWRLRGPDGRKFGQRVWCSIKVPSYSSSSSSSSDSDA